MIHGEGFFYLGSFIGFVNFLMDFVFSCLFFPIYDDIDIVGFPLVALHVFQHFASHLALVGLIIQFRNCATWSHFNLHLNFPLFIGLFSHEDGNNVFIMPFGSLTFASFFFHEALDEDAMQHVEMFMRLGDV
jgi:hypothetical protein